MSKHALVTLTFTQVEAEWLSNHLTETFDEATFSTFDEQNRHQIMERLDLAIADATESK